MLSSTEEIKSRIDIVEFINDYVPLKQAGANFKGVCPFHNEKTPSFLVSKQKQFFKCFGCGIGGDVFTFLQEIENIEFPEALQILAEKAGVEVKKQNPAMTNLKTRLYDIHVLAREYYASNLYSSVGEAALKYLKEKRQLTDETIASFGLGYSVSSWDGLSKFLVGKGYTDYEIKQSGLVVEKNNSNGFYDRFRDRIVFPIFDHHSKIVGFTARAMSDQESAKYVNSPQTPIYNKSAVLYGFDKAKEDMKKKGYLVLVEGNMDVIASHQAGVKNVVAASGTSLTHDQIRAIKRFTDSVVMSFDSDAAGVIAAKRSIEMLWQQDMQVKVIVMPEGIKDPDELILKDVSLWQNAADNAPEFLDYFFEIESAGKDLSNIEGKRQVAKKLLPWIVRLTDPISSDHYLKKLSELISVDEETLRESLLKYKKENLKVLKEKDRVNSSNNKKDVVITREQKIAERLLCLLVGNPQFIKRVVNKVEDGVFEGQYQEFYKSLLLLYTKSNTISTEIIRDYFHNNHNKLVDFFDALHLLYETEFNELTDPEISAEFEYLVNKLIIDSLKKRRDVLQKQIKQAEEAGDIDKANSLLQQFSSLN